jgi:hypothetical protein
MKTFEPGGNPSLISTFSLTPFVIITPGMYIPSTLNMLQWTVLPLSLEDDTNTWASLAPFFFLAMPFFVCCLAVKQFQVKKRDEFFFQTAASLNPFPSE